MANAPILDIPVELGLELVPAVGSDRLYSEEEFLDDVIDEVDRGGLRMLGVNL